mmetsp:Transcript_6769/g.11923  ORF Transcript_6769/g.11923 Transcript_6769/m.11923 type:complete len:569 (-) Transcript_6769:3135-4841(-)
MRVGAGIVALAVAFCSGGVDGTSLGNELEARLELEGTKVRYPNVKPRVRREWRQLSDSMRKKVASAYWEVKKLSTEEGQKKYGKNFFNHDEMLFLHAISTFDPRCDQGHYGPQFMTFHRALLLKYERALLAVDPSIKAMPYWDISLDALDEDGNPGKYRNNPDKYIFTDKYFGSYWGNSSYNYAITDGLFPLFPIGEYSRNKYGRTSKLAKNNKGIREEYFTGYTATTCKRCCFDSDCTCKKSDKYSTFIRDHDDCTPYATRNPKSQDELGGTYELVYTKRDFDRCLSDGVETWMDWQNCIEMATVSCNQKVISMLQQSGMTSGQLSSLLRERINNAVDMDLHATFGTENATEIVAELASALMNGGSDVANVLAFNFSCTDPMIKGYYTKTDGKRGYTNFFHSQAHVKFGADLLDTTTSPNLAAEFTSYHAHIDMNNMAWMMQHTDLESKHWTYPKEQTQEYSGSVPYGTSGPHSTYDISACANNEQFDEYTVFGTPWLPGTLYDDVVNGGFAFFDLFDGCDQSDTSCTGGSDGYTHGDILHWTSPQRTPYTYDYLAKYYYKKDSEWK